MNETPGPDGGPPSPARLAAAVDGSSEYGSLRGCRALTVEGPVPSTLPDSANYFVAVTLGEPESPRLSRLKHPLWVQTLERVSHGLGLGDRLVPSSYRFPPEEVQAAFGDEFAERIAVEEIEEIADRQSLLATDSAVPEEVVLDMRELPLGVCVVTVDNDREAYEFEFGYYQDFYQTTEQATDTPETADREEAPSDDVGHPNDDEGHPDNDEVSPDDEDDSEPTPAAAEEPEEQDAEPTAPREPVERVRFRAETLAVDDGLVDVEWGDIHLSLSDPEGHVDPALEGTEATYAVDLVDIGSMHTTDDTDQSIERSGDGLVSFAGRRTATVATGNHGVHIPADIGPDVLEVPIHDASLDSAADVDAFLEDQGYDEGEYVVVEDAELAIVEVIDDPADPYSDVVFDLPGSADSPSTVECVIETTPGVELEIRSGSVETLDLDFGFRFGEHELLAEGRLPDRFVTLLETLETVIDGEAASFELTHSPLSWSFTPDEEGVVRVTLAAADGRCLGRAFPPAGPLASDTALAIAAIEEARRFVAWVVELNPELLVEFDHLATAVLDLERELLRRGRVVCRFGDDRTREMALVDYSLDLPLDACESMEGVVAGYARAHSAVDWREADLDWAAENLDWEDVRDWAILERHPKRDEILTHLEDRLGSE